MNTIVEDVLIYLPAWTVKPKKNRNKVNAYMEDNDFKIFNKEETHDQNEYYEDLNIRKHITNKEVLTTFHTTKIRAATFLNRDQVPNTNICYNALCMWTAGVLEERYKFKTSKSKLITDAQRMIKPYYNYQFRVLGQTHNKIHKQQFENTLQFKIYTWCN